MKHFRALISARLKALRNRFFSGHPPGFSWFAAAIFIGGSCVLIAAGGATLNALIVEGADAPEAQSTPVLELAFWMVALASAFVCFRIMELLYRNRTVRALQHFPLDSGAFFFDRLVAAVTEGLLITLAAGLFFSPVLYLRSTVVFVVLLTYVGASMVASSVIGLGVQTYLGRTAAGEQSQSGVLRDGDRRGRVQIASQVFLYSPGIALAISLGTALILKLAFQEALKMGVLTNRVTTVVTGFVTVLLVVTAVGAARFFKDAYLFAAAIFRELDSRTYGQFWGERNFVDKLTAKTSGKIKRLSLYFSNLRTQYRRRYQASRYVYLAAAAVVGIATAGQALHGRLGAGHLALPAVVLLTLGNPWARTEKLTIRRAFHRTLPINSAEFSLGQTVFVTREVTTAALAFGFAYGARSLASGASFGALAMDLMRSLAAAWTVFLPTAIIHYLTGRSGWRTNIAIPWFCCGLVVGLGVYTEGIFTAICFAVSGLGALGMLTAWSYHGRGQPRLGSSK